MRTFIGGHIQKPNAGWPSSTNRARGLLLIFLFVLLMLFVKRFVTIIAHVPIHGDRLHRSPVGMVEQCWMESFSWFNTASAMGTVLSYGELCKQDHLERYWYVK